MPHKVQTPDLPANTLMLAYLCVKELKALNAQVDVLDRFGLTDDQIAAVCQAAIQSVRNARVQNKKANPQEKRSAKR
jgi:hypothetical protein